jgi:hypothetical protein
MLSFTEFLLSEETYYLIEGPPLPGNQLFHKDIGIPQPLQVGPPAGMKLFYGFHSEIERAVPKGIDLKKLPPFVPPNYQLIEVEARQRDGAPQKWVIRAPYDNVNDLVIVILASGKVKTVWTNKRADTHRTLNRSIYTRPQDFMKPQPAYR